MTPDLRQRACDAFNLLRHQGGIHKDALYTFLEKEDIFRQRTKKFFEQFVTFPVTYKENRDYVLIWRAGKRPTRPIEEFAIIEPEELVQDAQRFRYGKSLLT